MDHQVAAGEGDRGADDAEDALRERPQRAFVRALLDQDSELVAADPGAKLGAAELTLDASGERPEQLVPRRMTEGVVDGLEVVEVQEDESRPLGVAAASWICSRSSFSCPR
jgi:hypothetical protein